MLNRPLRSSLPVDLQLHRGRAGPQLDGLLADGKQLGRHNDGPSVRFHRQLQFRDVRRRLHHGRVRRWIVRDGGLEPYAFGGGRRYNDALAVPPATPLAIVPVLLFGPPAGSDVGSGDADGRSTGSQPKAVASASSVQPTCGDLADALAEGLKRSVG